jgi:hypothetical protein
MFTVDNPDQAMRRFNNALREAMTMPKDELRSMLAQKGAQMEEKRLIEGKKRRGPKPRKNRSEVKILEVVAD